MSILNAITFLSTAEKDVPFRKSCYRCKSRLELLEMLQGQGISFTPGEFEDAVNHLLLRCQTYEQADRVRELEAWFKLFPG
jgi:hypothetical protein